MSPVSVISGESGKSMGEFRYTTDWSGRLALGEVDTVLWTKKQEDYTPIDSVNSSCGDSVTLQLSLVEQKSDSLHNSVENVLFECVW